MTHTSSASGTAITIHSYDAMGRAKDLWQCTPYNCSSSSIWNAHYTHDIGGDLTSWQHPNGETITQTFSNASRVTQITSSLNDSTHPGTLAQNIKYAAQGAVSSLQNGCVGTGCTQEQETYDYNNGLQLARTQLGTSSASNANACLVYNYYWGVANPTTCAIPSQGATGNDGNEIGQYFQDTTNPSLGHTTTLTYDNLDRLATSVATGSSTHNLTFSYDRYGNMTCTTNGQTNGPCPNYTFSASTNQIINTGFTYDAAGNLTADGTGAGTHTYQWDAENRLKSIDNGSTATYTYNAFGRRVEKLVGSIYTEYAYQASGEELGENNRSNWTVRVIPFAGRHLAHYNNASGSDATFFVHSSRIGSTTQVTDYTGAVAQDQLYYPWGQEWNVTGGTQEKRFASLGHRDTTETGLDPTHFRMYSSAQGRWLSKDPKRGCGGDPQGLNRYAYVLNSPANFTDVMGTCAMDPANMYSPFLNTGGCDPYDASCNPCDEDPCSFYCPFMDTCGCDLGGGFSPPSPPAIDECAGHFGNLDYPLIVRCNGRSEYSASAQLLNILGDPPLATSVSSPAVFGGGGVTIVTTARLPDLTFEAWFKVRPYHTHPYIRWFIQYTCGGNTYQTGTPRLPIACSKGT